MTADPPLDELVWDLRTRRKLRHSAVMWTGSLVQLVGVAYLVSSIVGDVGLVALGALLYIVGAGVTSFGRERFDLSSAIRAYPSALLTGVFWGLMSFPPLLVAVLVAGVMVSLVQEKVFGIRHVQEPEEPDPTTPAEKRRRSLALRLLDSGLAQELLGGPVRDGEPASDGLVRTMSMATWHTRAGGGALTLLVRHLTPRARERMQRYTERTGEGKPGAIIVRPGRRMLCDGEWMLALSSVPRTSVDEHAARCDEFLRAAMTRLRGADPG